MRTLKKLESMTQAKDANLTYVESFHFYDAGGPEPSRIRFIFFWETIYVHSFYFLVFWNMWQRDYFIHKKIFF